MTFLLLIQKTEYDFPAFPRDSGQLHVTKNSQLSKIFESKVKIPRDAKILEPMANTERWDIH